MSHVEDARMGTVAREDGRITLRYRRRFPHPVESVWAALTEHEHLGAWLPCDIVGERRAGAAIELPFWPATLEHHEIDEPVLTGEIRVWEPPHVFEWTWDTDLLRFELAAEGDGTSLVFTTWIGIDDDEGAANAAAGYDVCLEYLAAQLDGRDLGELATADTADLQHRYRALVASHPRAS
jgi:uncharacterized protein YndB with AHSA1/START domain